MLHCSSLQQGTIRLFAKHVMKEEPATEDEDDLGGCKACSNMPNKVPNRNTSGPLETPNYDLGNKVKLNQHMSAIVEDDEKGNGTDF